MQNALLKARDGVGAKAVMERVEIQTHHVSLSVNPAAAVQDLRLWCIKADAFLHSTALPSSVSVANADS